MTTSYKASSVIPYGLEDKSKPNGHRVVDSIRIYVGIEGTQFRTRSTPERDLSETTCRYYRRRSRNRDGRGIHYWPNKGSQATRCSKSSLIDIRNLYYDVIVAIINISIPCALFCCKWKDTSEQTNLLRCFHWGLDSIPTAIRHHDSPARKHVLHRNCG